MDVTETGTERPQEPCGDNLAAMARHLLGSIAGETADPGGVNLGLRSLSQRIDDLTSEIGRLTSEIDRTNADRLRLMTELNNATARCASIDAEYRELFTRHAELVRKMGDVDGHGIGVGERIDAALLVADVGHSIGTSFDLTPGHAGKFMELAASQPSETR